MQHHYDKVFVIKAFTGKPSLLAQLSLEMKWDRLIKPAEPLTSHELQGQTHQFKSNAALALLFPPHVSSQPLSSVHFVHCKPCF